MQPPSPYGELSDRLEALGVTIVISYTSTKTERGWKAMITSRSGKKSCCCAMQMQQAIDVAVKQFEEVHGVDQSPLPEGDESDQAFIDYLNKGG